MLVAGIHLWWLETLINSEPLKVSQPPSPYKDKVTGNRGVIALWWVLLYICMYILTIFPTGSFISLMIFYPQYFQMWALSTVGKREAGSTQTQGSAAAPQGASGTVPGSLLLSLRASSRHCGACHTYHTTSFCEFSVYLIRYQIIHIIWIYNLHVWIYTYLYKDMCLPPSDIFWMKEWWYRF